MVLLVQASLSRLVLSTSDELPDNISVRMGLQDMLTG